MQNLTQKQPRMLFFWVVKERLRRALLDDLTVIHKNNAMGSSKTHRVVSLIQIELVSLNF